MTFTSESDNVFNYKLNNVTIGQKLWQQRTQAWNSGLMDPYHLVHILDSKIKILHICYHTLYVP